MWIVTWEANDYHQHGAYFLCAFDHLPVAHILRKHLEKLNHHVDAVDLLFTKAYVNGYNDDYYLTEVKDGEGL